VNDQALAGFFDRPLEQLLADPGWAEAHAALLLQLEAGSVRAAERLADGSWQAVAWVKQAILVGFRRTKLERMPGATFPFFDKSAYPPRTFTVADAVRLVPGGSCVRRGAHIASGVVIMPPAYVNIGAYIGADTMIDSHALVGSCAQIGARVHLSAGAQIGGVLEPPQAVPVVIEDEAFVGGLCGVFEGVVVRARAVLAPGVVLSAATSIYDLVQQRQWHREVPPGAVVVPGSRPATGAFAAAAGLQLATPVIVKYRDAGTDAATALESAVR